jgi:hypothetical protein
MSSRPLYTQWKIGAPIIYAQWSAGICLVQVQWKIGAFQIHVFKLALESPLDIEWNSGGLKISRLFQWTSGGGFLGIQ